MEIFKSFYLTVYKLSTKLLPLLICCLLFVCCQSKNTKQVFSSENQMLPSDLAININTASAADLEKLPHVGEKTALRIVEFREKFGRFRKPEHLLLVRGISDKHFREMRIFVKTE